MSETNKERWLSWLALSTAFMASIEGMVFFFTVAPFGKTAPAITPTPTHNPIPLLTSSLKGEESP